MITFKMQVFVSGCLSAQKKTWIPMPLLVSQVIQAFGEANGFISLITN